MRGAAGIDKSFLFLFSKKKTSFLSAALQADRHK